MFARALVLAIFPVVNALLFYHLVLGPTGIVEFNKLRQEHQEAQAQLRRLEADNIAMSREIRLLHSDDGYMEKMIRQRLHYLRDNETLYLFGMDAADIDGAAKGAADERKD